MWKLNTQVNQNTIIVIRRKLRNGNEPIVSKIEKRLTNINASIGQLTERLKLWLTGRDYLEENINSLCKNMTTFVNSKTIYVPFV